MAEYGMSGFPSRDEARANYEGFYTKKPEIQGHPVQIARRGQTWFWYVDTVNGGKYV